MTTLPRAAALTFGGLSLAITLAGCASPSQADVGSGASGGGSKITGNYTDGTYTATGSYDSPGGPEMIEVEVTLAGDIITEVTVTPQATDANGKRYQGIFAGGIAKEVVGVDIDKLAVDKVAGSSLTSTGFNKSIETIKADALA